MSLKLTLKFVALFLAHPVHLFTLMRETIIMKIKVLVSLAFLNNVDMKDDVRAQFLEYAKTLSSLVYKYIL